MEVSPQAVNAWHKRWMRDGQDDLLSTGPSGPRSWLDDEQVRAVLRELNKGPQAHGWQDQRWTPARIGRVITETTGVVYAAPDGVWRLLKRIGWSWQVPTSRAIERDEEATSARRTPGVAAGKRSAARNGAWIRFADGSGTSLNPLVRRTWSPLGRTPVLRITGKHRDRICPAGACCHRAGHAPSLS